MPQVDLNDEMVAGGIIIAVAAALSLFFSLLTLLHIFLALVLPAYAQRLSSPQQRKFILSPIGFYIICLFASNCISAMGGLMQTRWVGAGAITQGPACSSQAFMLQLGSNATALWIGVISVSALRTFTFRARSLSRMVTLLLICALWTGMIIFDALASTFFASQSGNFFYGIAFMWCWITPSHRAARLFTQYIWMWVWSLVSAVCFLLVFLSVRGNITMKRDGLGRSVKWSKHAFDSYALWRGDGQYCTLVGMVGKTMCWFPIGYITLTLPISVSRVLETFGFRIPAYAFIFSAVCFLLLGIGFPILYFAICHSLKHVSIGVTSSATLHGDTLGGESFHTPDEKRPSPVSKLYPYPWTPMPTPSTRESARPSHTVINGGEKGMSTYRARNSPLRRISVTFQLEAQSSHRPMDSTSTDSSSGTVVGPVQLSPVLEGESVAGSIKSQLTIPPAVLVAPPRPSRKLNDDVKLDLDKNVPLPNGNTSAYTGPCAISPDLRALLLASQTPTSPSGPPPPPRKIRRIPVPSVPVDVDESDQGSVIMSALPSTEVFDPEDIRPILQGRSDLTYTSWAAYEGGSPMTPNMPFSAGATIGRDTMRSLWADYEDSSPTTTETPMHSDTASFTRGSVLSSTLVSPDSPQFQRLDSSIALKPSISAVGMNQSFGRGNMSDSNMGSPVSPQFKRLDPSVSLRPSKSAVGLARMNISPRPSSRPVGSYRRSRNSTIMPAHPLAVLQSDSTRPYSSNSAAARLNGSHARKPSTSTLSEVSTDGSYRTPRPQPGYV